MPVSESDCPCSDNDPAGCRLPECSYSMNQNGLCDADQTLPNGDNNYDVNNCPGGHDVFRYQGGKTKFFDGTILTRNSITSEIQSLKFMWFLSSRCNI